MSYGIAVWDAKGQLSGSSSDRLLRVIYTGTGGVTLSGLNYNPNGDIAANNGFIVWVNSSTMEIIQGWSWWNNTTKALSTLSGGNFIAGLYR